MLTPEEMKAALTKMNDDAWHKRDMDAAYGIYSDEVVFHRSPFPPVVGKETNLQADAGMLAAFTDVHSNIDEMIVDGETAVIRWTWAANHTDVSPALEIPPTGKRVGFTGITVYRFKQNKIVEQWEYSDLLGFLQQLGVVPPLG